MWELFLSRFETIFYSHCVLDVVQHVADKELQLFGKWSHLAFIECFYQVEDLEAWVISLLSLLLYILG